jgi:glycine/D-amino acid oxidase-like deaminating enzyme
MKIVVVGGGVLGTTHALEAIVKGHSVIQIERDEVARSASVRNFGLIWVSGRRVDQNFRRRFELDSCGMRFTSISQI